VLAVGLKPWAITTKPAYAGYLIIFLTFIALDAPVVAALLQRIFTQPVAQRQQRHAGDIAGLGGIAALHRGPPPRRGTA
jgi:hypothetical protein